MKTKIVSSYTADSNPVKQEVNGTVVLPPLVFPGYFHGLSFQGLVHNLKAERVPLGLAALPSNI